MPRQNQSQQKKKKRSWAKQNTTTRPFQRSGPEKSAKQHAPSTSAPVPPPPLPPSFSHLTPFYSSRHHYFEQKIHADGNLRSITLCMTNCMMAIEKCISYLGMGGGGEEGRKERETRKNLTNDHSTTEPRREQKNAELASSNHIP